jgi:hypothetical protein
MLMSNFFTKRGAEAPPSQAPTTPRNGMSSLTIGFDALDAQPQPVSVEEQQSAPKCPLQANRILSPRLNPGCRPPRPRLLSNHRRSRPMSPSDVHAQAHLLRREGRKPKKLKAGQSKLSSFFTKPTTTTTTTTTPTAPANASAPSDQTGSLPSEIIDLCEDGEEMEMQSSSIPLPTITSEIRFPPDKDNSPAYSQSREKKNEKWEDQQCGILLVCGLHAQTAAAAALNSPPRASERVPGEQTRT